MAVQQWSGRSKGGKTGYGIFIKVLQTVGVRPAYLLLRFVAGYYFLCSKKSNAALRYYFRERLQYTQVQATTCRYKNYYWFGQALIDRIVLMAGIKNRFTFNFDGEQYLHAMVAAGKGGFLLSAHIGNWEIAGHLLQRLQAKINIVMYDGEQQQLKQYLENTTGARHANIIVIKDNLAHIYEIMDALGRNELVCMHADRFVAGSKYLMQPFLGREAPFPAGPFVLAIKLAVPVSFVFAMKESSSHYHFFASPLQYYKQAGAAPAAVLQHFAAAMEAKVRQYPLQWYNYYDFWQAPRTD